MDVSSGLDLGAAPGAEAEPPGGAPIPVSNGDNDLTGMVTQTDGDWLLEVFDTRKKKKGTLNSWSITIDY